MEPLPGLLCREGASILVVPKIVGNDFSNYRAGRNLVNFLLAL